MLLRLRPWPWGIPVIAFVVDCEAYGIAPAVGRLTELGCVRLDTHVSREEWAYYHLQLYWPGELGERTRSQFVATLALDVYEQRLADGFRGLVSWLQACGRGRAIMWSDNPAYDFMWVADGFARSTGDNPFGHSARRISDLYAGLTGEPSNTQRWKGLRSPIPHDHDPVNDAMGNAWALSRILRGERA